MAASAVPYIRFAGNTRAALAYYQSVFGGTVEVATFGDFGVSHMPEESVMHGALTTDGFSVYGYDAAPDEYVGDHTRIRIAIVGDDVAGLSTCFNALTQGGRVVAPLEKQQWGATYGEVVDQYGVSWMFNIGGGA